MDIFNGYFPFTNRELNFSAQKLMRHEAKALENDQLRARIIKSYELMLDFYGMVLEDKKTGKISRSKNFRPRYDNLNNCFHNYLRITRILKCLGEVGLGDIASFASCGHRDSGSQ